MRKSENFDLNLYEGTDIFNPLTTDVPNYEKIDIQMKKNYNLSVGKATELKTGTVHAITRENADCPMIHFTATSNFTSNDTFTVDGVQVSSLLVDGSTLPTNCYIIGSEVICYLKGTLLTFFLSGSVSKDSEKLGGELPTYYSKQEDFNQLETTVDSMSGIVEKNTNDIIEINNSLVIKTITPTMINGFTLIEPNNIRIKANKKMITISQEIQIPNLPRDNWYDILTWNSPVECDFYVRLPMVFNDGVASYVDAHIYTQGISAYLPVRASRQTLLISGTTISWV